MTEHNGKPVAAYIRVSSTEQRQDRQYAAVRRWAMGEGIDPDSIAYYAEKESGATMHRAKWLELMQHIAQRRYKVLVIDEPDRLGRAGLYESYKALEYLRSRGVELVFLSPRMDLRKDAPDGGVGELIYGMYAWAAYRDNVQRGNRIKAGLAAKRARGERIGGSGKGHGSYRHARRGTQKHAQYQRILSGFQAGLSLADVVADSGVCERTVCRIKKQLKEEGVL